MDKAYPPEAWKRLGKVLEARRGQLGYGFRQRANFLADNGGPPPSAKTLARLERGERYTYPPATVTRLEALYQYDPGSFEAVLAGGDPVPLAAGARPAAVRAVPPPPPQPPGSSPEEVLAGLLETYRDDDRIQTMALLGARRGAPPRVVVAEIWEWLEFLGQLSGKAGSGTSAGLHEKDRGE